MRWTDRVTGPVVIPVYLGLIVMFGVACVLGVEDYHTTRLGYMLLPTNKHLEFISYAVALLPYAAQVVLFFAYWKDRSNNKLHGVAGGFFHVFDGAFDVYFKVSGAPVTFGRLALAIAETELLYTVGSELLLTWSFTELIILAPKFFKEAKAAVEMVIPMIVDLLVSIIITIVATIVRVFWVQKSKKRKTTTRKPTQQPVRRQPASHRAW